MPSAKIIKQQMQAEREKDINNMSSTQILWYLVKRERFTLIVAYAVIMSVAFVVVV